jgi:hypothetical protein
MRRALHVLAALDAHMMGPVGADKVSHGRHGGSLQEERRPELCAPPTTNSSHLELPNLSRRRRALIDPFQLHLERAQQHGERSSGSGR